MKHYIFKTLILLKGLKKSVGLSVGLAVCLSLSLFSLSFLILTFCFRFYKIQTVKLVWLRAKDGPRKAP